MFLLTPAGIYLLELLKAVGYTTNLDLGGFLSTEASLKVLMVSLLCENPLVYDSLSYEYRCYLKLLS